MVEAGHKQQASSNARVQLGLAAPPLKAVHALTLRRYTPAGIRSTLYCVMLVTSIMYAIP